MKQPRISTQEVLSRPANRSLLAFLARTEEPVRIRDAREALQFSIAQLGLAMRSLERNGLAIVRHLPVEGENGSRLQHPHIEATDMGREQARGLPAEPAVPAPNLNN